jgi:hypothetical protein
MASEAKFCPFIKKNCVKHKCVLYAHLIGMNPQTGQPTDEWGCSLAVLPILLVENSNVSRQATASMDKVANEVRHHHQSFLGAVSQTVRDRIGNTNLQIPRPPTPPPPPQIPRNGDQPTK